MTSFKHLLLPLLAIFLCLAIAATIIAITISSPSLTESGPLSGRQHTEYAVVSTLVATLLTTIIVSRIRQLWVHYVDLQLAQSSKPLDNLNSRWRTALSLAGPLESLKHSWVVLSYIVTGLITTSIVAALTPTPGTKIVTYSPSIPNDEPNLCVGGDSYDTLDYWNSTSLGREFGVNANMVACPLQSGLTVIGSINTISPSLYAYADHGVAVQSSALAAPVSIYDSDGAFGTDLSGLLAQYGTSTLSTKQCVPVMLSNPYSCRAGGTINAMDPSSENLTVTSNDGTCTIGVGQNAYTVEPTMVKGYCLHGEIGQGTLLFAGASSYANTLAQTIDYPNWRNLSTGVPPSIPGIPLFSVECTIDARFVFDWSYVQLGLQNSSQTGFNRILSSVEGESCIADYVPSTDFDVLAALAATAMYQALRENTAEDGFFQSIANVAIGGDFSEPRTGPWAFPDSTNALEDVLGLTAALVVSRNWQNATLAIASGFATVENTRVGSGTLYGVAFVVPPLIAAVVLVCLIVKTWDRDGRMDKKVVKTSSLKDLLERNSDSMEFARIGDGTWHDIELVHPVKGGNTVRMSLLDRGES